MQNAYYKESLTTAVKMLAVTQKELFSAIFHIAMAGELHEWNKSVEIGEVYEFSSEIFEGCTDTNIQLLTQLMMKLESTYRSISNLNGIEYR